MIKRSSLGMKPRYDKYKYRNIWASQAQRTDILKSILKSNDSTAKILLAEPRINPIYKPILDNILAEKAKKTPKRIIFRNILSLSLIGIFLGYGVYFYLKNEATKLYIRTGKYNKIALKMGWDLSEYKKYNLSVLEYYKKITDERIRLINGSGAINTHGKQNSLENNSN